MPVDKIIDYIGRKNPHTYEEQLDGIERLVNSKIQELMTIQSQIRDQRSLVKNYREQRGRIFIKHFETRHLLPLMPLSTEYAFEISVPDFYDSLVAHKEHSHLHSSRNLVILKEGEERTLCIQITGPDQSITDLKSCKVLNEGEYLCLFHSTADREDYRKRQSRVSRYLKQNNLSVRNISLDIYSSDNSIYYEDNESSFYQLLLSSE